MIRNLVGNLLIGLARIITIMRSVLLFIILIVFCFGILVITLLSFFELISYFTHQNEVVYYLFNHWYWDLIVFLMGGTTMFYSFLKMIGNSNNVLRTSNDDGYGRRD